MPTAVIVEELNSLTCLVSLGRVTSEREGWKINKKRLGKEKIVFSRACFGEIKKILFSVFFFDILI